MKSQVRTVTSQGIQYPVLAFMCPGCMADPMAGSGLHMLPVNTDKKSPAWTWDGNLEVPTINPSILTRFTRSAFVDDEGRHDPLEFICHSWLHGGVFHFLEDSTHALKGQHVPIPDLPDWVTREVT